MAGESMNKRGQTPADYLIGISLLLVTIIGVFVFVPTVFDPFEAPTNPDDRSMAERVSGNLVENATLLGKEQTVDLADVNASFDDLAAFTEGIPDRKRVNVTLWKGDRRLNSTGDPWPGDVAVGTSSRTIASYQEQCEAGCRLVVRVWTR